MTKTYCDFCGDQLVDDNKIKNFKYPKNKICQNNKW